MRFRILRDTATVLAFAAITATSTLAVVMPRTTHADDFDELGVFRMHGADIDGVRIEAGIARDPKSSTGWSLVVDATNDGDDPRTCQLQTALERSWITPMARVGSEVTTLLTRAEKIEVAAHGKAHLRREVPAWIVQQLVTAEKMAKARNAEMKRASTDPMAWNSAIMRAPYPDFRVAVLRPDEKPLRVRMEGGMAMPPPRIAPPKPQVPGALPVADNGF